MKKTAIKPLTKDHIQRRKMWRGRFLESATKMLTAPGCNSDDYKAETAKAAAKVAAWGGGKRPANSSCGSAPRITGDR